MFSTHVSVRGMLGSSDQCVKKARRGEFCSMSKKTPKVSRFDEKPESFGTSNKGAGKAPQIRHQRPEVAKHVARVIIANNGDISAAVSKMLDRKSTRLNSS